MDRAEARAAAVAETVATVRAIEAERGVTRDSLAAIRDELLALAARRALFPAEDFPPPEDGLGDRLYAPSMHAYLDWEVALAEQVARDGTLHFPEYPG